MYNIPTMLTIKETAQKAGLAEHYVRQLILQNKVIHVKAGKKYLINFELFVNFLNTGECTAPTEATTGTIRRLG